MSRHFSPERGKIRKGKYEKAKEMMGVEGSRNSSFSGSRAEIFWIAFELKCGRRKWWKDGGKTPGGAVAVNQ